MCRKEWINKRLQHTSTRAARLHRTGLRLQLCLCLLVGEQSRTVRAHQDAFPRHAHARGVTQVRTDAGMGARQELDQTAHHPQTNQRQRVSP